MDSLDLENLWTFDASVDHGAAVLPVVRRSGPSAPTRRPWLGGGPGTASCGWPLAPAAVPSQLTSRKGQKLTVVHLFWSKN